MNRNVTRPSIRDTAEPGVSAAAVVADDLAKFLIAKAPVLAAEFASGQMDAVDPETPTSPSWMLDIAGGEVLTTNDAAAIVGVTTSQAIRTRCERAEEDGFPIGVCFGGAWLISLRLLLANIERKDGLPARLSAESHAKKLPKFGSKQKIALQSD
jgi:hypothetical protein